MLLRHHLCVRCAFSASEECSEGRCVLGTALDRRQDRDVVVQEVYVRLQLSGELDENVTQTLEWRPHTETRTQLLY